MAGRYIRYVGVKNKIHDTLIPTCSVSAKVSVFLCQKDICSGNFFEQKRWEGGGGGGGGGDGGPGGQGGQQYNHEKNFY